MAQKFTNIDKCRGRQVMDNNEGTELEKSCPPKEDSFDSVPYRKEFRWSDIPILQGKLGHQGFMCNLQVFKDWQFIFIVIHIPWSQREDDVEMDRALCTASG